MYCIAQLDFYIVYASVLLLTNYIASLITRDLPPHAGRVVYAVNTSGTLMDQINGVVSGATGVSFEGVWLLLVYWDSVTSAMFQTQVRT